MPTTGETLERLAGIPNLTVSRHAVLAPYTRFGIGGPADVYAETEQHRGFRRAALAAARESGAATMVIGGGTNLIVSDEGFRGVVLRYRGTDTWRRNGRVMAQAGAELQGLVDFAIARGLAGLETLAGIPAG